MAKPSTLPTWATDATIASGPDAGLSPILEPASGVKAQGNVAGQGAAARWYNWLFNLLCQWIAYLNNLPSESAFLNGIFSWTNAHTFGGNTTLAGTTVSADDIALTTPRPRTKWMNVETFRPEANPLEAAPWRRTFSSPSGVTIWGTTGSGSARLIIPTDLPEGSTITRVRVYGLRAGTDGGCSLVLAPMRTTGGDTGAGSRTLFVANASGTGEVVYDTGTVDCPIGLAQFAYVQVQQTSSASSGVEELVFACRVDYTQAWLGGRA